MMRAIIFLGIFIISANAWSFRDIGDCTPASRDCTIDNCKLPDCSCSDAEPAIPLEQRPQVDVNLSLIFGVR